MFVNVVTYHKCINVSHWHIYGNLLHLRAPHTFTLSPVSWFSEQCKSKTPGSVRQCSGDVSLGNKYKNELQAHTQDSLYDTYFKHGIGWHTKQFGKEYCQRYDDFQGDDGHFIGNWLNIVYFSNTPPESFPAFQTNRLCMFGLFNCSSLFYSILNFPRPFSAMRSLAMAYHFIGWWIV